MRGREGRDRTGTRTSLGRETRGDADTTKVLTMDDAKRIAANIASYPASDERHITLHT
jgi:hypothetical protein